MEQDFSMQVLTLREDHIKNPGMELIRSRRCISCSKDNQFIICGSTAIYVIDLMVSHDLRSERDLMSTKMYTTPLLNSLPPFSFNSGLLNTRESVLNITEEQRQVLITDPSLYTYPSSCNITISPDSFEYALPSPVSHNSKHRTLLAALTSNHRIIFYEEGQHEWNLVLEMSELLYQRMCSDLKRPFTLGKAMSFDEYKNLCHSMSTVEILWSPVFSHAASDPFHLFFTATKSGSVHVWKVGVGLKTLDDIKFVCTHKASGEITSMSWRSSGQYTGLLAIGQFDGALLVLQVTCQTDGQSVTVVETYTEPEADHVAVVALDWIKIDDGTIGLVVCKEYYVLLYTYTQSSLVFCQHQRVEGCLPISGLSMHGSHGAICTLDSQMYTVECDGDDDDNGKAVLSLTKIKPLSLPLFTEVEYLSYGMCLSAHGMVCFSVHRPNRNFTKNTKRLVLETFKVTLTAPFSYSAESVLSSMVPHNMKGFTEVQPSIQDILILQKLHLRDIDYADEIFEEVSSVYEELSESNNITILHVVHNLLLYTKQCFIQRGFLSEKEVDWLMETLETTSRGLLTRHVRESYGRLPNSPSREDLTILGAMRRWAESCQLSASVPEGLLVKLEERFPQIKEIEEETCSVCGENFTFENRIYMKCSNGHKMKACCLTFLPCQMYDARYCNTCNHAAVPISKIKGSVLVERPDICSLCGGRLLSKFL